MSTSSNPDIAEPTMPASHWYSADGYCIPSRELRYVLTAMLRRRWTANPLPGAGTMKVAELVDAVQDRGIEIASRPSKTVSDALRAEVARGRVVRVGRGYYATGTIPDSTWRYIRSRADAATERYAHRRRLVGRRADRLG